MITADEPRYRHAAGRIEACRLPGVGSSKPVHDERPMQAFRAAVPQVYWELEAVVKGQGQGQSVRRETLKGTSIGGGSRRGA